MRQLRQVLRLAAGVALLAGGCVEPGVSGTGGTPDDRMRVLAAYRARTTGGCDARRLDYLYATPNGSTLWGLKAQPRQRTTVWTLWCAGRDAILLEVADGAGGEIAVYPCLNRPRRGRPCALTPHQRFGVDGRPVSR